MKNFNELNQRLCACTEALTAKLDGSNGKRAILLCGGTGCISSNSMDIKAKFDALVEKHGLQDKVSVNIVGCFGFCSQGPFVKIFPRTPCTVWSRSRMWKRSSTPTFWAAPS